MELHKEQPVKKSNAKKPSKLCTADMEFQLERFGKLGLMAQVYLIHELRNRDTQRIKLIGKEELHGHKVNPDMNYQELIGIEFGDFNELEQGTAWKHWEEVTSIGYGTTWIPIQNIKSITYY